VFTGLIEAVGKVARFASAGAAARLIVEATKIAEDVKPGDSVNVNGACLTATRIAGGTVGFDVSAETLRVATIGRLKPGDKVNLERSLRADDRLGGHFVLGHVDAVGKIVRLAETPGQWTLEVQVPRSAEALLVPKGSVAVDGISLTVATLEADRFSAAIIPTTLRETNLQRKSTGDAVNVEFDVLGKYVVRLLGRLGKEGGDSAKGGGLTLEDLSRHGFA